MRRGWLAALAVAGLVLVFAFGLLIGRVITPFTRSEKPTFSGSTPSRPASSGFPSSSSSSFRQTPPPIPPCDCYGPDLDCDDFPTWEQAQRCYEHCLRERGFDVFRLDADGDGIACEKLRYR